MKQLFCSCCKAARMPKIGPSSSCGPSNALSTMITSSNARGARVIRGEAMRALQLNRGAEAATSDAVVFVHADTLLPLGAARAISEALRRHGFGGFRLKFAEADARLRVAETMINLRTAITKSPWGDQAQFISRKRFLRNGGFREIPIMEDYELAVRMKRSGSTVIVPLHVLTSGRRFLAKGVWKTAAINWRIITAYRLGGDPEA